MDTQENTLITDQDELIEAVETVENTESHELSKATTQTEKYRKRIDKLIKNQSIKFRGIFSHRAVRIVGFVFLYFAQIFAAVSVLGKLTTIPTWASDLTKVLEIMSSFALPLFLAANFCVIMTSQNNIKKTLIFYSTVALSISLLIIFVYYRYIVGLTGTIFNDDPAEAAFIAEVITKTVFGKIINYNVFIDLSLFSLFYFFFFYKPKNIRSNKALLTFRYMSILPVLFAITSSLLYGLYYLGKINLPVPMLTIMPCRSIMIYAIFFTLAIIIKLRRKLFIKWGGTEEEYNQYSNSNKSSLEISVVVSVILLLICIIDFLLFFFWPQLMFFGIGTNFFLAISIPFIMLLSYTRRPKKSMLDWLIVLIFIFMTIILYFEIGLAGFKAIFA